MTQTTESQVHVVMVAPLYPATSGPATAAAMRARGLARGLARLGHRVTVVCAFPRGVEPDRSPGVEVLTPGWLDLESLARSAGINSGTLIQRRLGAGPPRHTILRSIASRVLPDRYATWVPSGIRATRKALTPGAVLFSTGPRSSHIAARVARDKHPWVTDLNDLWALNPHTPRRMFRDRVEQFAERLTVGTATELTTVNDLMAEELQRRFEARVTTIFSGFDPSEFDLTPPVERSGRVRILFAGTVYRSLDLRPFLQAVKDGKDAGWLRAETLEIAFVGRLCERVALEADNLGVSDIVTTSGLIPRKDLLRELVEADALLLPLYETDPYALPMRFFEYVGSGRPIIGYGPPDRIPARLINDHGLGVVVSNRAEVEALLRQIVDNRTTLAIPAPSARVEFTWDRSIEKLHELVTRVAVSR